MTSKVALQVDRLAPLVDNPIVDTISIDTQSQNNRNEIDEQQSLPSPSQPRHSTLRRPQPQLPSNASSTATAVEPSASSSSSSPSTSSSSASLAPSTSQLYGPTSSASPIPLPASSTSLLRNYPTATPTSSVATSTVASAHTPTASSTPTNSSNSTLSECTSYSQENYTFSDTIFNLNSNSNRNNNSDSDDSLIKRRKMGHDVDFLDDSGVPMDGVELDSSSAPSGTNGNSGGSLRLSSPTGQRAQLVASTTNNSTLAMSSSSEIKYETRKPTIGIDNEVTANSEALASSLVLYAQLAGKHLPRNTNSNSSHLMEDSEQCFDGNQSSSGPLAQAIPDRQRLLVRSFGDLFDDDDLD